MSDKKSSDSHEDYRFVVFLKNGEKRCGWYRDIVRNLGLEADCFLDQPLDCPTFHGARYVACVLKKEFSQIGRVTIFKGDNEIFSFGIDSSI